MLAFKQEMLSQLAVNHSDQTMAMHWNEIKFK
jgi:hypothetical protein